MQLLLVRHADAGNADEFAKTGMPDEFRPLSPKGHKQMKKVVPAIRRLVPTCRLIAASPYERALETAASIREIFPGAHYEETSSLEPERTPEKTAAWLRAKRLTATAILVGHEPHLGRFLEWCVNGTTTGSLELKKAGACLIEFPSSPAKGKGCLLWLMGPKELAVVRKR